VEFVRAFYLGLVRYGFPYPRAFEFARDEFVRLGYVAPSAWGLWCVVAEQCGVWCGAVSGALVV
jgi:hypothetical protein